MMARLSMSKHIESETGEKDNISIEVGCEWSGSEVYDVSKLCKHSDTCSLEVFICDRKAGP